MLFKLKNKKGMAGIVTVVLVLALLASVATSYIKLMQTENSVTVFSEQRQKAADAAFCGISYAMAQLQTQSKLFKASTKVMDRKYIAKNIATKTKLVADMGTGNLIKGIESKWNYMDKTMMVIDNNSVLTTKPPYRFRVFSYPQRWQTDDDEGDKSNEGKDGAKIDLNDSYYMVKSQGEYFEYDDTDTAEVIATYTAQYLAQLKIDRAAKRVYLYRYKPVPYQAENEFYKYLSKMN